MGEFVAKAGNGEHRVVACVLGELGILRELEEELIDHLLGQVLLGLLEARDEHRVLGARGLGATLGQLGEVGGGPALVADAKVDEALLVVRVTGNLFGKEAEVERAEDLLVNGPPRRAGNR